LIHPREIFSVVLMDTAQEKTGKPTYEISRLGIGFVPEDRRIFSDLTVWENLDVAIQPRRKKENTWTLERVFDLFPALKPIQTRKGGYLSGGEQQMLTIARTLMGNPDLLLLDEPSEGLAPIVVQQLGEQIAQLRREGMTILLCEQNQRFSLDLSDRLYILEKGTIKYEGTVQDFKKDESIGRTYLAV
jgi:branched-chain amino acid transport system ATP-binding protein